MIYQIFYLKVKSLALEGSSLYFSYSNTTTTYDPKITIILAKIAVLQYLEARCFYLLLIA